MAIRFCCAPHAMPARRLAWTLPLALGLLASVPPARAADRYWACGSGPWDSTCWAPSFGGAPNGGIPGGGDSATIRVSSPSQPLTVSFTAASTPLGPLDSVALQIWGPAYPVSLQFSDGVLMTGRLEVWSIGYAPVTWRQSGGQVQVTGTGLTVGDPTSVTENAGPASIYELAGGTLIAASQFVTGTTFVPGRLEHSAGLNSAQVLRVGGLLGPDSAVYRLQGAGVLSAGSVIVGQTLEGRFEQMGGAAELGTLKIGSQPGSYGTGTGIYALGAGTLQAVTAIVGDDGPGQFDQSGGLAVVSGSLALGRLAGSNGSVTLTGGTLRTAGTQIGLQGSGSFVQLAGEHLVTSGLQMAAFPGSQARYDLAGGRLAVGGNLLGGSGTSVLVLSGGQLDVAGIVMVSQLQVQAHSLVNGQVIVSAGRSLSVNSDVTAVFSGPVDLQAGALLAGGGTKVFDGPLALDSGAVAQLEDPGSVRLGARSRTTVQIAGAGALEHDHLALRGSFSAGGELVVNLLGYAPQAGDRFDLFDWDTVDGSFSAVRLDGAPLAPGLAWDLSQLYITGELGVAAVPEAPAWALLLAGLAWLARARRASTPQG